MPGLEIGVKLRFCVVVQSLGDEVFNNLTSEPGRKGGGGGGEEQGTPTHPTDYRGRPLPFLGAETRPVTLENLKRITGRRTRREGG